MSKSMIVAFSLLLLGSLIYIFFRNDVLFLSWLDKDILDKLSIKADTDRNLFLYIIVYCLPDALWYLALLITQALFVNNGFAFKILFAIAIVIPFVLEICQYFDCFPGTFDIYDIIIYLLTLFVFLLCKKIF